MKQKQAHRYREQTDGCQTSSYKVNNGDTMYNIENIVNNIIITLVTDGYWAYFGDHFVRYIHVESLCYTLETNILCINYY